MLYPQEIIEEIRMGNDIVDVVSSYVPLKQKGSLLFGICPFHNENSPSFSVTPDKQIFYCFGCGVSGNVYSFIMQIENFSFPDAIQFLADRINFKLPEKNFSEEMIKNSKIKENLFEINKTAAKFFYNNLGKEEGLNAVSYLDEREVFHKVRIKFGLGYSLKNRDSLFNHLLKEGYELDNILKTGLVLTGQHGEYYDRFFGRLMFPIFDAQGRIVGFGGRILYSGEPKYLNSPDSIIFNKSQNLYGINYARLSKTKTLILVEGYMDVISLYQVGFTNSIAALGTSFNNEHVKLLKKYADTVIILFDSDEAGTKAVLRAIPILTKSGIKVKILQLPNAKDPDEYIKKFGIEAFKKVLDKSTNHIIFQVNYLKNQYNLNDTDEKVQFTLEVSKILSTLDNAVERDAYSKEIARITDIDKDIIKSEINKISEQPTNLIKTINKQNIDYIKQKKMNERGIIEAKKNILYLIATNNYICKKVREFLEPDEMNDEVYEKLLKLIYDFDIKGNNVYPAELINYFETIEEQKKVSDIFSTIRTVYENDNITVAVNDLVKNIKKNNINEKISGENDATQVQKLLEIKRNIEKLYITI